MRGQAAGPGQPTHSHSQSDYAEYLHFTNNDLIALYEENNVSWQDLMTRYENLYHLPSIDIICWDKF